VGEWWTVSAAGERSATKEDPVRVLVQRVDEASVSVEGRTVGAIGRGFLALVGVAHGDTHETATKLAAKTARLRVFADEAGLMNRGLADVGGEVLAVSQFTLYADTRRGNRPGFTDAAPPEQGDELYSAYVRALRAEGVRVETGAFGAHMRVSLVNDGPVTILLEA
jgi:D-tyrosyl-tRNA(Tyr) deacylase